MEMKEQNLMNHDSILTYSSPDSRTRKFFLTMDHSQFITVHLSYPSLILILHVNNWLIYIKQLAFHQSLHHIQASGIRRNKHDRNWRERTSHLEL